MEQEKDYLSDVLNQENFGYTLASPGARLGAVILEGLITWICYLPVSYFSDADADYFFNRDTNDYTSFIMQLAITAALGALFYSMWSGNLGHKLLGLKVISSEDGSDQKKASMGAARETLKSVLGMFIVPSIWLLWDNKNQNLYDKITKTLVVVNR